MVKQSLLVSGVISLSISFRMAGSLMQNYHSDDKKVLIRCFFLKKVASIIPFTGNNFSFA
jgi:hypothetical protein